MRSRSARTIAQFEPVRRRFSDTRPGTLVSCGHCRFKRCCRSYRMLAVEGPHVMMRRGLLGTALHGHGARCRRKHDKHRQHRSQQASQHSIDPARFRHEPLSSHTPIIAQFRQARLTQANRQRGSRHCHRVCILQVATMARSRVEFPIGVLLLARWALSGGRPPDGALRQSRVNAERACIRRGRRALR